MWGQGWGSMKRKQPGCRPDSGKSLHGPRNKRGKNGHSEAYVCFTCGIE